MLVLVRSGSPASLHSLSDQSHLLSADVGDPADAMLPTSPPVLPSSPHGLAGLLTPEAAADDPGRHNAHLSCILTSLLYSSMWSHPAKHTQKSIWGMLPEWHTCAHQSSNVIVSMNLTWVQQSQKFLTLKVVAHAGTLESAEKLLSLSTQLSQPHAPANIEDGMGSLHQSAEMPAIPPSSLMATPHHVATMHAGKSQIVMLTSSRFCL